jgi:hypothetical protein
MPLDVEIPGLRGAVLQARLVTQQYPRNQEGSTRVIDDD